MKKADRFCFPRHSAAPSRGYNTFKRWMMALLMLLVGASGMLYLPMAQAVPAYVYLYSGKPFSEGPFFDPDDPRADEHISIKITSPTPLTADGEQRGTTGLNFWMSDGTFNLKYPEFQPPYDMTYPIFYGASLSILDLGDDGLPASWSISLNKQEGTHGAFNRSLTSSYYSDGSDLSWDNSYDTALGPIFTVNDPGQWHMYIETNPLAVPEPSSALLLGLGLVAIASARKFSAGSS